MRHLQHVLETLSQHKLFAKFSKCSFGVQKIEYFGQVVSKHGVKMDTSKVHAILQWDIPTTLKQLRGFLGFSGYYRIFISNYATIARPLTDLLKKDSFL